ncbi:unnamed protein product [Ascophyllum nodosum]
MSSFRATRASRAKTSSLLLPLIPDHETSELAVGYDAQKAKQMSSPEASKGTSYSSEEGFKESIAPRPVMVPATSGKVKHHPLSSSWDPLPGGAAGSVDTSLQITLTPARSHDASGNPRNIMRDNFRRTVSARAFASSSASFRTASTTQLYSEPLACEGEGSVFPLDLPLSHRRAFEVEIIQRFDRLAINTNVGDFWVIIDATWMNKWIDFVLGKADPPGPVSNLNLFEQIELLQKSRAFLQQEAAFRSREGGLASRPDLKLKEGLQLVKDYRAVDPVVWFIYREIYDTDGAPLLCRRKPNLYAEDMVISKRLKGEEASHTKAVYELRRFVGRIKEAGDRAKQ